MKRLYKLFLILVAFTTILSSCSKDMEMVKIGDVEQVEPPVILNPEAGSKIALNIDSPNKTALVVEWEKIDYGVDISVTYKIEIAQAGTDFSNPIEIGLSNVDTFAITHFELNNKLLSLGLSPDQEGEFDLRIKSSVTYQFAETISNSIGLVGIPYFDPSVLPEELYMTGASLNAIGDGGWNWDTNYAQFVPVHSHPELFWAIVWLDPTVKDAGVKIAPQRAWVGDFGVQGDAVDGVWAKGGDNIVVPEANYYIVVVDYINETIEANPANVYGIGDVFGGWDSSNPANLFTIDKENKVITYDGAVNAGELRMHAGAKTLNCDWWQAEFIILNGEIVYRGTGDDQERVPISAGNATISLDFMDNTGSIVQ